MEQALLQLIPLGLAAALSTVPITATVFILLSDSHGRSGPAFLAGTVLGTLAAVTLATVAGQALPGRQRHHDDLIATLEVVVGAAMVLLGIITWARRDRSGSGSETSWLANIGSYGTLPTFGLALALNVRPKAVLLTTAAGLAISKANLRFEDNVLLAAFYTALATNTVVIPIVAAVLAPGWMEPRLRSTKAWIAYRSTAIGSAMTILAGAFIIALGISG